MSETEIESVFVRTTDGAIDRYTNEHNNVIVVAECNTEAAVVTTVQNGYRREFVYPVRNVVRMAINYAKPKVVS
jgi:glutamate racemase